VTLPPFFLASAGPLSGSGFSLWQTLGGLVAVFALLLLSLRLLGRFNQRRQHDQSALLTVWNLGPRREIQVLKLQDQVHYIYRHDGAMVLLKQDSLEDWQRVESELNAGQAPHGRTLARIFSGDGGVRGALKSILSGKPDGSCRPDIPAGPQIQARQ